VNKLTDMIADFQWELKAGIPRIIELFTDSDGSVRSMAVEMIKTLAQRGKEDKNGK
jgi:hypothetical protein